jgi:hypothetical protein
LDGNAAAKQAFINAAATWESKLKNPVIIVMDVDYGITRFGTVWNKCSRLDKFSECPDDRHHVSSQNRSRSKSAVCRTL